MNEHRPSFQQLADQARFESGPSVNVAHRVAERIAWIEGSQAPRCFDWPTWSAAGLSMAAAMMMMFTLMHAGISLSDPFGDWLSSLVLVMS